MIKIIAHRGARMTAPENTIASIESALELNIYGVEFDVELTKDNVPVVVHQETLSPYFDRDKSKFRLKHASRDQTTNWINNLEYSQIKKIDAGSWFNSDFEDESIPTLSEVLSLNWENHDAVIELKDPYYWKVRDEEYEDRLIDSVIPICQEFQRQGGTLQLISFNEHILQKALDTKIECEMHWLLWTNWEGRSLEAFEVASRFKGNEGQIFGGIRISELMLLNENSWKQLSDKNDINISVYPVSPAYDEPEFALWTPENRRSSWKAIMKYSVGYLTTDFPSSFLEE